MDINLILAGLIGLVCAAFIIGALTKNQKGDRFGSNLGRHFTKNSDTSRR